MDTSEKYIKMCGQAQEIQDLRKFLDSGNKFELWEDSDFCRVELSSQNKEFDLVKSRTTIFNKSFQSFLCDSKCLHHAEAYSKIVWLSRQDQLQEIALGEDNRKDDLLRDFVDFYNENLGENIEFCDSFEVCWLLFIMNEAYNKIWDKLSEKWINNKICFHPFS